RTCLSRDWSSDVCSSDLEQGEPIHALGSPGGARIINYVAQTLIGLLDWELDMQAAIDIPHVTNLNGATALEQGSTIEDLADALKQRGHTVNIQDLNSDIGRAHV